MAISLYRRKKDEDKIRIGRAAPRARISIKQPRPSQQKIRLSSGPTKQKITRVGVQGRTIPVSKLKPVSSPKTSKIDTSGFLDNRSLFDSFKDIFDANTERDRAIRLGRGEPELYDAQQRKAGVKRPIRNPGQAFFGGIARFLNTAKAGAGGALGLAQIGKESVLGTDESFEDKLEEVNKTLERDLDPNSGLFGAGTLFKNKEEASGPIDPGEFAKKVLGGAAGVAGEGSPILAGRVLKAANLAGKTRKANIVRGAGLGGGENLAADTGEQLSLEGEVDPARAALAAVLGSVMGGAGGAIVRPSGAPSGTIKPRRTPPIEGFAEDARVRAPERARTSAPDERVRIVREAIEDARNRPVGGESPRITSPEVPSDVTGTARITSPESLRITDNLVEGSDIGADIVRLADPNAVDNTIRVVDEAQEATDAQIARIGQEGEELLPGEGTPAREVSDAVRTVQDTQAETPGAVGGAQITPRAPGAETPLNIRREPGLASTTLEEAEEKVVRQLPKTIREKIARGQGLTRQDAEKINEVRTRVNRELGVSPEQTDLGLGVATPTRSFQRFENLAQKETPAGNIRDIAKGNQGITKEAQDILGEGATSKPGVVSRVISANFPSVSAKQFRALASNLNGLARKSPEIERTLDNAVFRPILENQAQANRLVKDIKENLIVSKNDARLNKPERDQLTRVLDGQLDPAQVSEPVARVAEDMRQAYDTVLDALNREELAAGVELTPRRQDYFPHIRELMGEEKYLRALKDADPDFIRRVGTSFGHSKARTGKLDDIKLDPFEVMDAYLSASKRRIGTLVPSRNINLVIDTLDSFNVLDQRGQRELTGWLKGINDDLTGTGAELNILLKGQARIAGGTVLGNPSSTLLNFIQPAIQVRSHPINSMKGLYQTFGAGMRAMAEGNLDNYVKIGGQESSYLRNAFDSIDLRRLEDKSIARKFGDVAARIFYTTDMFSKKQVIETFYAEQVARGLNPGDALRAAERQAETLLPSRTPGTLAPALRNHPLGRAAALFQTEVLAQGEGIIESIRPRGRLNVNADTPGGNVARGGANLAGMMVMGHLFNQGFKQLFPGRGGPAPDPIGWAQNAWEPSEAEKQGLEEDTTAENVLQFLKQGAAQLPIVGTYFDEFGGRSPFQFPIAEIGGDIAESVGDVLKGETDKESLLRAGRQASALIGRGGKPAFRAVEGTAEFYSDSESKGFDTERNNLNLVRSILGGAHNTPQAREFFDNLENRDSIINAFDSQTVEDYENIIGRGAEVDGEYNRYKSVVDEGVKFERLFQNPNLIDMFTALGEYDKSQGKPLDPVFDIDFYQGKGLNRAESQKTAFRYLAAKSQEDKAEERALKETNPWLKKLDDERSKFFDKVTGTGKDLPEISFGPSTKRPELEGPLKNKIDRFFKLTAAQKFEDRDGFLKNNPEVGEYLDQAARYERAKRKYLGKPLLDKYPEPSKRIQGLMDQYYELPKGTGDRSGFLKQHPEIIDQWIAQNIWTIQNRGAISVFEGIKFDESTLKAIDRLANNIVENDDGEFVISREGDFGKGFGGSGFKRFGSGGRRSSGASGTANVSLDDLPTTLAKISKPSDLPKVKLKGTTTYKAKKFQPKAPAKVKIKYSKA